MTTALALRRCKRCGTPIGAYRDCGDPRCMAASYLLNPMRPNIPEPAPSPRTPDAWIAEHCHEWESPLGGNE